MHLSRGLANADREIALRIGGDARKRCRPALNVLVSRVLIAARAFLSSEGLERVDAVGCRWILHQGRRSEKQPIDDAEHRGIRADSEAEGRHHRDRETRLHAQAANGVAQILLQALEGHDCFDTAISCGVAQTPPPQLSQKFSFARYW